jgi:hypothetical protein
MIGMTYGHTSKLRRSRLPKGTAEAAPLLDEGRVRPALRAVRLQLTLGFRVKISLGLSLGVKLGLSLSLGVELGLGVFSGRRIQWNLVHVTNVCA